MKYTSFQCTFNNINLKKPIDFTDLITNTGNAPSSDIKTSTISFSTM